jgi:hypothetical protein
MTTKEYLQQIGKLNKMINNKMIELAQMKEMAYSIKAVGTDERVMSSSDPDKTGCAYAKIEEMEEKINGMIDNYIDTKEKIINQIESIEAGNLTELEKANKALETANNQIAELQKSNAIRDLREKAMTDFKITAEQAKTVVKEDGSFDTTVLGQIISEKETALLTFSSSFRLTYCIGSPYVCPTLNWTSSYA